jgi:hypothetical protein
MAVHHRRVTDRTANEQSTMVVHELQGRLRFTLKEDHSSGHIHFMVEEVSITGQGEVEEGMSAGAVGTVGRTGFNEMAIHTAGIFFLMKGLPPSFIPQKPSSHASS